MRKFDSLGRAKKIPVSVVILTKNEELAIQKCIESVQDFDQILVFDSNSTDKTLEICSELKIQVIDFIWNGQYPKKKQWALENSAIRNDWVLFLDADERAGSEFVAEIREMFASKAFVDFGAFDVNLDYFFLGKKLKYGHKVRKRAVVNRLYCKFPEFDDLGVSNMWEVEGHYQPNCIKKVGRISVGIQHEDPDPLYDYFARHNRYSDWEAEIRHNKVLQQKVRSSRTNKGQVFDRFPIKPLFFFIYSFFLKAGFLDGRSGLQYATALSVYYWQVDLKVFEKRKNASTK
jgi:glycosyltransferase involved in cell wall biosynthesis